MNVVDSSGWLEYFAKGPNTTFFKPAIHNTKALLVPTICLYEVYKWIVTQRDEEEALAAIAWMAAAQVIDLNQEITIQAADLSLEHKLAMADSIIYVAHFAGLEGVEFIEKKK
jgi:predicted nucleic acid-binding protein